jgi:hypothetical protein
MVLNRIKIVDLTRGTASVTNDIENVLRKIEAWHQGSIAGYRIMYRDADGVWDGVDWDGENARFLLSGRPMKPRRRRSFWRTIYDPSQQP